MDADPAEQGDDGRQLPGVGAEREHPVQDRGGHPSRQGELEPVTARPARRMGGHGVDELGREEGHPTGSRLQRVDERRSRRLARTSSHERRELVVVERPEGHWNELAGAQRPLEVLGQRGLDGDVGPPGPDDEHPLAAEVAHDEQRTRPRCRRRPGADRRSPAAPVCVSTRPRGTAGGRRRRRVVRRQRWRVVVAAPDAMCSASLAVAASGRSAAHRATATVSARCGPPGPGTSPSNRNTRNPSSSGRVGQAVEEHRLADARLAGDQHRLGSTRARAEELLPRHRQLSFPPDEPHRHGVSPSLIRLFRP